MRKKYQKTDSKIGRLRKIISRKNIVWFLMIIFVVIQVFFAIQTSSSGAVLTSLELTEKKLHTENQQLASDLVRFTSLTETEKQAERLEFYKPENTLYLNTEEFVARSYFKPSL